MWIDWTRLLSALSQTKRVSLVLDYEMYSELLDYTYLRAKQQMSGASMGELIREFLANELRRLNDRGD